MTSSQATLIIALFFASLLGSLPSWAQNIQSLESAKSRIKLETMELQGFDASLHKHVSEKKVLAQLSLERDKFPARISIDEIHQVADAMTLYFRRLGYAFHTVYLPPQQVQGNSIALKLIQGRLIDVHIINQSDLSDKIFESSASSLVNKLLYAPAIEQKVQALKLQQGFDVFAFFSRGASEGEARLNLKVQSTDRHQASLRMDNYGTPSSGEYRLLASYSKHQLSGHHDHLSLAVLRSVDGIDNTYGSLSYSLPSPSLRYRWNLSLSNHQFEVGDRFESLGLQGDTQSWSAGMQVNTNFLPRLRSSLNIDISEKESHLESIAGTAQAEISQSVTLSWQKQWQSVSGRWMSHSRLQLSNGKFGEDSQSLTHNYTKFSYSQLLLLGAGRHRGRNIWQLSWRGQHSEEALPTAESLSLTGIYGVRGFAPGLFSAEQGNMLSLEWRWPNLLNSASRRWRAEPILLADWASGDDGSEQLVTHAEFSSIGLGLRLNLSKHLNIQANMAQSLSGRIDSNEMESDEQLLFELRWQL